MVLILCSTLPFLAGCGRGTSETTNSESKPREKAGDNTTQAGWKRFQVEPGDSEFDFEYGLELTCVFEGACTLGADEQIGLWEDGALSRVEPVSSINGGGVGAAACFESDECIAISSAYDANAWYARDGEWTAQTDDATGYSGEMSCPSERLCHVLRRTGDDYTLATYDDGTWNTAPAEGTGGTGYLMEFECAAADLCAAESQEALSLWDGSTWTVTDDADGDQGVSLGCGGGICMAATTNVGSGTKRFSRVQVSTDGSAWREVGLPPVTSRNTIAEVACGSPTMCLVVFNEGDQLNYSSFDGSAWSPAQPIDEHLPEDSTSISEKTCVSEDRCIFVLKEGAVLEYRHND